VSGNVCPLRAAKLMQLADKNAVFHFSQRRHVIEAIASQLVSM